MGESIPSHSVAVAEGTVAVPDCPVCGSSSAVPLHSGLRDRVFGTARGAWDVIRCLACGAARLDPRPADDVITALYRGYYTHAPPQPNLTPTGVLARFLRALRNDHIATLGYQVAPRLVGGGVLARLFPPLAAIFDRAVRSLPLRERLLDVGAGNGAFIAEAVAAGWDACGIDIDPDAVAAGRAAGLDLRVERINDRAAREPGSYDAVTMSHILEHVPHPVAFLRHAYDLLRPGGLVWVATPNLGAAGHAVFGRDWMHLDPPRHLVLFDAPSLARALVRAGFRHVEVLHPTPSAWASFRISHAVRSEVVPANDERSAPLHVWFAAALAELAAQRDRRRAEELVVHARKP